MEDSHGTYGARKVWLQLNREGVSMARCTVERLMRSAGLVGVRRGKTKRTTVADPGSQRAADLVQRRFAALVPDRLWVADITYVSTWSGWVYVALVTDAYARRILGWRVATTMSTQLVLDALEQAIWTRQRADRTVDHVVAHSDRGSQYTSIRYSERFAEVGIAASMGQRRRLLRQRPGRVGQQLVQGRSDPAPRPPGAASTPSSSPPPNGSTGTTTGACTSTARHSTSRTRGRVPRSPPSPATRRAHRLRQSPDTPREFTSLRPQGE